MQRGLLVAAYELAGEDLRTTTTAAQPAAHGRIEVGDRVTDARTVRGGLADVRLVHGMVLGQRLAFDDLLAGLAWRVDDLVEPGGHDDLVLLVIREQHV